MVQVYGNTHSRCLWEAITVPTEQTPTKNLEKENMFHAIMFVSETMKKNEDRKLLVSFFVDEIFEGLDPR